MSKYGDYKDQPILAELYDLVPDYMRRSDIDFYLQDCMTSDGRILELGCGTGRILIPIAEAGCLITGLDFSKYMLSKCQQKLQLKTKDVQNRVRLIQGDMINLRFDGIFHKTIIPFHAFQHLITGNDQLSCLCGINRHLAMKGQLIIDVFHVDFKRLNNPRFTEEIEDFAEYELIDGRRLRRTHRITAFHQTEQYNDVELIYYLTHPDGKTERIVHAFPFRYFFRYEMEHLLERCGFRLVDLFGDFNKSSLSSESHEMIFVTEKYKELD